MPSSTGVLTRRRRRLGAAGAAGDVVPGGTASTWLLAGGDTLVLLDLRDDAGVRVEEGLRHAVPAAEVDDREQTGRGRELVVRDHALHDRPVAVVGEDLLGLGRVQVVEPAL